MKELTIKKLENTEFTSLYLQLLKGEEMTDSDIVKLLAVAILLLNHDTPALKHLGYRIVLFYGNLTGRYEALYDVALNSGLHPISAVISSYFPEDDHRQNSFIRNIVESYVDTFREQGIVFTEQQDALHMFIQSEYKYSSIIVAPTSYGKSELIINSVRDNPNMQVLVLVPSKALLAQTKKRLIYADIEGLGKVITHPEMYSLEGSNRLFVLTQERLSRLLNEHPKLTFDMVFVDEAHNLLQNEHRSELLAAMLCVLGARKPDTSFKYLTPFLCDELNVKVRFLNIELKGFRVNEYIKSERFYLCDFRSDKDSSQLQLYDHFFNTLIKTDRRYDDYFELLKKESLSKNIIYGNKKKNLELFAVNLAATLESTKCPLIEKACNELEEVFDKKYNLITCLRKGVMYHHGSIPDTIRLFLENLFSSSKEMKYLVCNSTLLEGVNLPIERLFIFDCTKGKHNLTSSQFKNLIGRVNRFSEVFSTSTEASLKKLESSIYLLGIDGFTRKNANLHNFYKNSVRISKADKDSVGNVLLEATKILEGEVTNRFKDAINRIENLHPGLITDQECKYVTTEVGKLLIANGVNEINVFNEEIKIDNVIRLSIIDNGLIDSPEKLMFAIQKCFIEYFDKERKYSDLIRLENAAACRFYAMLLDWKLRKYNVKKMILLTLKYWESLVSSNNAGYVFVGNWGDCTFNNSKYEHWVRISTKNYAERINLAIVRLKDENDFFENKVFKFVEVLNGLGALETTFYKRIKYGTDNDLKIKLIRDGYSHELAGLLLKSYSKMVGVSVNGEVEVNSHLIQEMKRNNESDLLLFEAKMNIKPE